MFTLGALLPAGTTASGAVNTLGEGDRSRGDSGEGDGEGFGSRVGEGAEKGFERRVSEGFKGGIGVITIVGVDNGKRGRKLL